MPRSNGNVGSSDIDIRTIVNKVQFKVNDCLRRKLASLPITVKTEMVTHPLLLKSESSQEPGTNCHRSPFMIAQRKYRIPPHILGRNVANPESDPSVLGGRRMQKPRLGVKVPYRNLTSQIVTHEELNKELLERSKRRNPGMEASKNEGPPGCRGYFFTMRLMARLAHSLPQPKLEQLANLHPSLSPANKGRNPYMRPESLVDRTAEREMALKQLEELPSKRRPMGERFNLAPFATVDIKPTVIKTPTTTSAVQARKSAAVKTPAKKVSSKKLTVVKSKSIKEETKPIKIKEEPKLIKIKEEKVEPLPTKAGECVSINKKSPLQKTRSQPSVGSRTSQRKLKSSSAIKEEVVVKTEPVSSKSAKKRKAESGIKPSSCPTRKSSRLRQ